MAGAMDKHNSRKGQSVWDCWADVPPEVQSAVLWAFWAGGPADVTDQARYEAALDSGVSFHEAAFLEEPRWMVRGLRCLNEAGAFGTRVSLNQIHRVVGLWLNKSEDSVKREAGGYGLRGKPRSARWAVEGVQDWMKENKNLGFLAKAAPDFQSVLHLLEPELKNADFESWRTHFGDNSGRQIKATWSDRVLRKHLFQAEDGVHLGYLMRDLPSQGEPGRVVNHFFRLDPTPMRSLEEADFSHWLNRLVSQTGASAFPPDGLTSAN